MELIFNIKQTGDNVIITIDRIENGYAVAELEDGKVVKAPIELFGNAKEGNSYQIMQIDNPIADKIEKLMNEVFDD